MNNVDVVLRRMKIAGAAFESARNIMKQARRFPDDKAFVRAMVRIARDQNHLAVLAARTAREWASGKWVAA